MVKKTARPHGRPKPHWAGPAAKADHSGGTPVRAGRKELCIGSTSTGEHPTPFLTLFLIWRLHRGPAYGWALLQEMRGMRVSGKKSSTIYATLGKLEKTGIVKSRLEKTGARMRRLYLTTEKGWALFERIRRRHIHGLLREFIRTLAG